MWSRINEGQVIPRTMCPCSLIQQWPVKLSGSPWVRCHKIYKLYRKIHANCLLYKYTYTVCTNLYWPQKWPYKYRKDISRSTFACCLKLIMTYFIFLKFFFKCYDVIPLNGIVRGRVGRWRVGGKSICALNWSSRPVSQPLGLFCHRTRMAECWEKKFWLWVNYFSLKLVCLVWRHTCIS
jgi:hypothetical protein